MQSIKKRLFNEFPDFKNQSMLDFDDHIYIFFGSFGSYVQSSMEEGNIEILQAAFSFLNELILDNDDPEFLNMIVLQIFEKFYDKREYLEYGKSYLCPKGIDLLLSISNNFKPFQHNK